MYNNNVYSLEHNLYFYIVNCLFFLEVGHIILLICFLLRGLQDSMTRFHHEEACRFLLYVVWVSI